MTTTWPDKDRCVVRVTAFGHVHQCRHPRRLGALAAINRWQEERDLGTAPELRFKPVTNAAGLIRGQQAANRVALGQAGLPEQDSTKKSLR